MNDNTQGDPPCKPQTPPSGSPPQTNPTGHSSAPSGSTGARARSARKRLTTALENLENPSARDATKKAGTEPVNWQAFAYEKQTNIEEFLKAYKEDRCQSCKEPFWWVPDRNGHLFRATDTLSRHHCRSQAPQVSKHRIIPRQAPKPMTEAQAKRLLAQLAPEERRTAFRIFYDTIQRLFYKTLDNP
jgi:hypothetical protein